MACGEGVDPGVGASAAGCATGRFSAFCFDASIFAWMLDLIFCTTLSRTFLGITPSGIMLFMFGRNFSQSSARTWALVGSRGTACVACSACCTNLASTFLGITPSGIILLKSGRNFSQSISASTWAFPASTGAFVFPFGFFASGT